MKFEVGDEVVYTGTEYSPTNNEILVCPGDIGIIAELNYISGNRIRCKWNVARCNNDNDWYVDADKCVLKEIYNTPLFNVMREDE